MKNKKVCFYPLSSSHHLKDISIYTGRLISETTKLLLFAVFQAWEQSAGIVSFPVQLLASEVSKLLTKEIRKKLNGKPAGNSHRTCAVEYACLCSHGLRFSVPCNMLCCTFKGEKGGTENNKCSEPDLYLA